MDVEHEAHISWQSTVEFSLSSTFPFDCMKNWTFWCMSSNPIDGAYSVAIGLFVDYEAVRLVPVFVYDINAVHSIHSSSSSSTARNRTRISVAFSRRLHWFSQTVRAMWCGIVVENGARSWRYTVFEIKISSVVNDDAENVKQSSFRFRLNDIHGKIAVTSSLLLSLEIRETNERSTSSVNRKNQSSKFA